MEIWWPGTKEEQKELFDALEKYHAKAMSGRSDETLFKAIKEGGPSIEKSILMPPLTISTSDLYMSIAIPAKTTLGTIIIVA